jgi:hypothetical protein
VTVNREELTEFPYSECSQEFLDWYLSAGGWNEVAGRNAVIAFDRSYRAGRRSLLAELEVAEADVSELHRRLDECSGWRVEAEAERDQLRAEVERLREVAIAAWTDLFGGEPGEAVAQQLWESVVSAVAGEESSGNPGALERPS